MSNEPTVPHILVVEDDDEIRESVKDVLEMEGYAVSAVCDGGEALAQLRSSERPPDLILLDVRMPKVDGFQFRREQLQSTAHADIPVAVMTSDGSAREKAAAIRAQAFIQKPVQAKALLDVIERILGGMVQRQFAHFVMRSIQAAKRADPLRLSWRFFSAVGQARFPSGAANRERRRLASATIWATSDGSIGLQVVGEEFGVALCTRLGL